MLSCATRRLSVPTWISPAPLHLSANSKSEGLPGRVASPNGPESLNEHSGEIFIDVPKYHAPICQPLAAPTSDRQWVLAKPVVHTSRNLISAHRTVAERAIPGNPAVTQRNMGPGCPILMVLQRAFAEVVVQRSDDAIECHSAVPSSAEPDYFGSSSTPGSVNSLRSSGRSRGGASSASQNSSHFSGDR